MSSLGVQLAHDLIDIPADARQMRDARDGPEEFVGWLQRVATESAPGLSMLLEIPESPANCMLSPMVM